MVLHVKINTMQIYDISIRYTADLSAISGDAMISTD